MQAQPHKPPPPLEAWLEQAADLLAAPLLCLRSDGTLVHANAAALKALEQGQPLQRDGDRVMPAFAVSRPAFSRALADAAVRARGAPQALPEALLGCRATLAALQPRGGGPSPRPLLLLALAACCTPDIRPLASLHGLSEAQARLLACLVQGDNPAAAATRLGIADAALDTELAALLRQTGHADLPALRAELSRLPALAPPAQGE